MSLPSNVAGGRIGNWPCLSLSVPRSIHETALGALCGSTEPLSRGHLILVIVMPNSLTWSNAFLCFFALQHDWCFASLDFLVSVFPSLCNWAATPFFPSLDLSWRSSFVEFMLFWWLPTNFANCDIDNAVHWKLMSFHPISWYTFSLRRLKKSLLIIKQKKNLCRLELPSLCALISFRTNLRRAGTFGHHFFLALSLFLFGLSWSLQCTFDSTFPQTFDDMTDLRILQHVVASVFEPRFARFAVVKSCWPTNVVHCFSDGLWVSVSEFVLGTVRAIDPNTWPSGEFRIGSILLDTDLFFQVPIIRDLLDIIPPMTTPFMQAISASATSFLKHPMRFSRSFTNRFSVHNL